MRNALIVLPYVSALPLVVLGVLVMALCLSETHEFGPLDPRYLLLVHGSDVARIAAVEPVSGSVRYTANGQDGTAPARVIANFKTQAPAEQVIEIYKTRCAAMGLVGQPMSSGKREPALRCDCDQRELGIQARQSDDMTDVTIGSWVFERP
jgi:hypothetical protein